MCGSSLIPIPSLEGDLGMRLVWIIMFIGGYLILQVVCRQLSFLGTGARAYHFAHYGQGSGPIVLDNVRCTGLEAYITDCPSNGLYIHNCRHYEDAGVSCVGKCVYTYHTHQDL